MNKFYQKIELTANVLIIIVAALLGFILVKSYFFPAKNEAPAGKTPVLGKKISVNEVDFSQSDKNVLLVLSKGCRFCSESAGFYRRLIDETKGKNVNFVAVLPQDKATAEEYLQSLNLKDVSVKQSQLDAIDVAGTPTLIVTDKNGEVSKFWIGKLPPEKEKEVLETLN